MCLLAQNMEFDILNNGNERIFEMHHVWLCTLPHEHNKIGVSMSYLWPNHICIEKNHELWDGGGPI
jgi:hypothetical protein